MLFIFGFGPHQQELGAGATRACARCGNTVLWRRILESRRLTLFFIPVARWGRRDLEVCPICGHAVTA